MLKKAIAHAIRSSQRFIVYASLIIAAVFPAGFQNSSDALVPHWETYLDQRFGFQIQYPNGWYIFPRDDSESQ